MSVQLVKNGWCYVLDNYQALQVRKMVIVEQRADVEPGPTFTRQYEDAQGRQLWCTGQRSKTFRTDRNPR